MIRNETQYASLRRKVERLRASLKLLEYRAARGDPDAMLALDDDHATIETLQAAIREYEVITSGNAPKRCIPHWQAETGDRQIAQSLFATRMAAGLSQEEMADALQLTQSAIAKMESPCKENYSLIGLDRWAAATGYRMMAAFVRPGNGHNDPDSISRLGIEATQIKGFFSEGSRAALVAFLKRLQFHTRADVVTCYLVEPELNLLNLIYKFGIRASERLIGYARPRDLSWRLLYEKAAFVADVSADANFRDSDFVKREHIQSACHLPFSSARGPGIVFLSYRRRMEAPTPEYWSLLKSVSDLAAYMMAGAGETAHDNDVVPTPAPQGSRDSSQSQIVDYLEDLLTEHDPDLEDFWAKDQIRGVLHRTMSWLGMSGIHCTLHVVEGESVVLRNASPRDPVEQTRLHIGGDFGIVSYVAATGKPVIVPDLEREPWKERYVPLPGIGRMASEIAVPIINNKGDVVGVINVESENREEFTKAHAKILERVGHVINTILQTRNVLRRVTERAQSPVNRQRIEELVRLLFDALRHSKGTRERLQIVADLINDVFTSSIVDIWPVDWTDGAPHIETAEGVNAVSPVFVERHGRVDRVLLDPRPNMNSVQLVTRPRPQLHVIADVDNDPTVSPPTRALGIRSLVGAPVFGTSAVRSDGIIWIRFEERKLMSQELLHDVRVIAGFVHLIWNPISYRLIPNCGEGADTAFDKEWSLDGVAACNTQ